MDQWLVVLFFFVITIGGSAVFSSIAKQKELRLQAEHLAFAEARGWRYSAADGALTGRFLGVPFGRGDSREVRYVFEGQHRSRNFIAFYYTYTVTSGSGKDRTTTRYHFMVVGMSTPSATPTLEVSRAGFGSKLAGFFGAKDLQLESEVFNDAFRIETDNDKFAYDVLHPRTMQWMLEDQRFVTAPFRFERSDLLTWQQHRMDTELIMPTLNYLCDIVDAVPAFVWDRR
ncbi:MAG: hypothetical protein ACRCSF_01805 [Mycobacteriaceae bacterium]